MESEKKASPSSNTDGVDGREYFGIDNTLVDILNQTGKFYLIGLLICLCLGIIFAIVDVCIKAHRARKRGSISTIQQPAAQGALGSFSRPNSSTLRRSGDSEARKWSGIRDLTSRSTSTSHMADVEMQVLVTPLRQPAPPRSISTSTLHASSAFREQVDRLLAARFNQRPYVGLDDSIGTTRDRSIHPPIPQTDLPAIPQPVTLRGERNRGSPAEPPPTYASHEHDEIPADILPDQEPPVYGSAITDEEIVTAWARREAGRLRMSSS